MLSLPEIVKEVEKVFADLDAHISSFQDSSGLHCKFNCGKCCFKPDIEATEIEFLPFAHYLHLNGQSEEWYERLQDPGATCLILNPSSSSQGLCTEYRYRGLICRLFGYSARTNKYGERELVTCSIIKSEQAEAFEQASRRVRDEADVSPVMSQYYMRLHSIDYQLAQQFYPINEAIRKALETVMQYYAYRDL